MIISEITKYDFDAFWPVFKQVVWAKETYAINPEIDLENAYNLWCLSTHKTFVVKDEGQILGSYYLKANSAGPSAHICNCGYMVSPQSRGKGIARMMCLHSQDIALELGYTAMQFNSVVSSNKIAIELWKKLGYNIIGTIPNGFKHQTLGFVDSYIMHKEL